MLTRHDRRGLELLALKRQKAVELAERAHLKNRQWAREQQEWAEKRKRAEADYRVRLRN